MSCEPVEALEEAIAVIRTLWTPGLGIHLQGRPHSLNGAYKPLVEPMARIPYHY